jgi:tetratricopeptide (TPR) repeat protein
VVRTPPFPEFDFTDASGLVVGRHLRFAERYLANGRLEEAQAELAAARAIAPPGLGELVLADARAKYAEGKHSQALQLLLQTIRTDSDALIDDLGRSSRTSSSSLRPNAQARLPLSPRKSAITSSWLPLPRPVKH